MAKSNLPASLQAPKRKPKKKASGESSKQTTAGVRAKLSGRSGQLKTAGLALAEFGAPQLALSAVRGYRGLGDQSFQVVRGTGVKRLSDVRYILGLGALVHALWKPGQINPHTFNVGAGLLSHYGQDWAEKGGAKLAGKVAGAAAPSEGIPDGAVVLGNVEEVAGPRRLQKRLQRVRSRVGRRSGRPGRRGQRYAALEQSYFGGGGGGGYADGGYGDEPDVIIIEA